jgi:hypothetical protein
MVAYNTDISKLQVYGPLTDNTTILNEIFLGSEYNLFFLTSLQGFNAPVSGQVIAVEFLIKNDGPSVPLIVNGEITDIPSLLSYTWITHAFATPISIVNGSSFSISLQSLFFSPSLLFATNNNYVNGSACCGIGADDFLFRVHIQPIPGSLGWQNMN